MNESPPEVVGRKRTFSSRQKVLEEKKIQQQREEAERLRAEEEKRMQREARRREKKDKERKETMRVQRIEEQGRNEMSGYYGQNYTTVHPVLTNKSPSKPSTVIMPEYDAFSEGMTPECIIGATDELGELCFFVKWKGTDDADFVPAKKAKIHCPQLVIRYYENIISWN